MVFVYIKSSLQKKLLKDAIIKAGSERKLEYITGIPKSSIYDYKNEKYNMTLFRLNKILSVLNLDVNAIKADSKLLQHTWGRSKGGRNRYLESVKSGYFNFWLKTHRSKDSLKLWHRKFRLNDPERYYKTQYNRFHTMAIYKFKTLRGDFVRNKLERATANFLFKNKVNYEYEPFIRIDGRIYFPDFKINKFIIECTEWNKPGKVLSLKHKIEAYKTAGFNVVCIIPPDVQHLYKDIKKSIIGTPKELPSIMPG